MTRDDIYDAACLAAHFSKARGRKVIKVDYTERRNVSRPRKAPLGLVELSSFKTIKVKKDVQRLKRLLES